MYAQVNTETDELEAQVGDYAPGSVGPYPPPPEPRPGIAYYPLAEPIDWSGRPSSTSIMCWNGGAYGWREIASVEQARSLAWEAAKAARDAAEAADFEFDGVMYQPDVQRITGAAVNALMAQMAGVPFSIDWTVSDNSVVTLDGAKMQALGLALASRINAVHETGRTLRAAIAAATTPAAAYESAVWPTEEPNA